MTSYLRRLLLFFSQLKFAQFAVGNPPGFGVRVSYGLINNILQNYDYKYNTLIGPNSIILSFIALNYIYDSRQYHSSQCRKYK